MVEYQIFGIRFYGIRYRTNLIVLVISIIGFAMTNPTIRSIIGVSKNNEIDITQQIQNLDNISDNLNVLQGFVEKQRENLKDEQIALESLRKERQNLKPLVESDREIVEALFKAQEKRQSKNVWFERAFGFFAGILASLISSFIYAFYIKSRKKK